MTVKRSSLTAMSGGKSYSKLFEKQVETCTTTPAKIDLHDAHAIRRELAALYRDARSGRVDTQDATRMAYILELLRKSYETAVLQQRLESLEQVLNQRKGR